MQMEFYVEFTPEPSPASTPTPSHTPPLPRESELASGLPVEGPSSASGVGGTRTGGEGLAWDVGVPSQASSSSSSSSSDRPSSQAIIYGSQPPTQVVSHSHSQARTEIGYTDYGHGSQAGRSDFEGGYPTSQAPTEVVSSQERRDPYHAGVSAELGRLLNGYVGPAYGAGHGHGSGLGGMGYRRGESASEAAVAVALALRDGEGVGEDEGKEEDGDDDEERGMDTGEDFVFGRRASTDADANANADLAEIMERRRVAEGFGYAS